MGWEQYCRLRRDSGRVREVCIKVWVLASTLHLSKWVRWGGMTSVDMENLQESYIESNDAAGSLTICMVYVPYFVFKVYLWPIKNFNSSFNRTRLMQLELGTYNDAWYQTYFEHTINKYFGRSVWGQRWRVRRCLGGNVTAESVPGQREWRNRKGERSVLMEEWGLVSFLHLS